MIHTILLTGAIYILATVHFWTIRRIAQLGDFARTFEQRLDLSVERIRKLEMVLYRSPPDGQ